jgi:hypothetical protein
VRFTGFDDVPLLFRTCSCATLGCASVVPLICAARVSELTTLVGTVAPFTVSDDCELKFVPFTVTVTLGVPAGTAWGTTWLMLGLTDEIIVSPDPHPRQRILAEIPVASAL